MTTTTDTSAPISPGARILKNAANFFSFVFSPLLGPTYAIAIIWNSTIMYLLPTSTMRTLLLVVFGLTCVFPMLAIAILYKLKIVSDPGLNRQKERTIPFAISAAGYIACIIFLRHIHSPGWLTMFMAGGLVALVIAALINTRWKISVHLTAMGGLMAFVVRLLVDNMMLFHAEGWLIVSILAAGLVGTSRLILRRHTPIQVLAGWANGFVWVYLLTAITY